jgi:uncharacterized protein YbbC (DUF1343 family)
VTLAAIFGPQHGFRSDVQDNMIETPHGDDASRRVPVYSLYSETREPTPEMLKGLDVLLIDLQDIGARIYTYIYTMANCLRAAARHHIPVVVCDRPNPINGIDVEGNVTEKEFTSFVGQFELPTRPGMTIGEMAKLFNEHFGIGCDLEVVKMTGWGREMWHEDTGLPWILPSPNIPTIEPCVVFPATVHFEGTELSEGRGTTKPFELNGAPFIDAEAWASELRKFDFPGIAFREAYFQPWFSEFAGETCSGIQLHVTERAIFTPVIVGIAMVKTAREMYPDKFQWRQNEYEYEFGKNPFDVVCGTDKIRKSFEAGDSLDQIVAAFEPRFSEFKKVREKFLLY